MTTPFALQSTRVTPCISLKAAIVTLSTHVLAVAAGNCWLGKGGKGTRTRQATHEFR